MPDPKEGAAQFDKLRLELRRGVLVLAVLAKLAEEHYGYSLRKSLVESGIDIDESTLYPLVRRLEQQGLLASTWREGGGRRKRYYRRTDLGDTVFTALSGEWQALNGALATVVQGENNEVG